MAFSTSSCLFFFLLTLVLFSTQINARDSYSFGKVQREKPTDQNPNSLVPNQTNEKKEPDDVNPAFLPQSSENGYGLYGHETTYNNNEDQLNNNKYEESVNYDDSFSTPSLSQTAQTQESYKNFRESYPKTSEIYDNNKDTSYPKTTEIYDNNKDASYYEKYPNTYEPEKREKEAYNGYSNNGERQGMSDTSYPKTTEIYDNNKDTSYPKTSEIYDNNRDTRYYKNPNTYGTEMREKEAYNGYSNNVVERQGMSDTRYMANGNYYYDLDDDRKHGRFYQNHYYNYKPTGYNEKKSNFRNPYDSNQQSEMFGEDHGDQFTP